jgi:hypothetical protein
MDAKALLGALALLVGTSASADGIVGTTSRIDRAPAAMLYLEFPIAARHRERPAFGFRMERVAAAIPVRFGADNLRPRTLMDLRFNRRDEDPRAQALNANGLAGHPGAIVGIVVGGLAVLSALSDDSDGSGGGY